MSESTKIQMRVAWGGSEMKRSDRLKAIASGVVLAASSYVHAQSSGTAGAEASVTTPMNAASSTGVTSHANDRRLAKSVRHALDHTKGITPSGIRILAKHGKVTLAGTVPVSSQIARAGTVAAGVPGVVGVDNRLTVAVNGN